MGNPTNNDDLKERIEKVLIPLFGESIKGIIDNYYSENDKKELYELVSHMLRGYLGDKKAEKMLLDLNFIDEGNLINKAVNHG